MKKVLTFLLAILYLGSSTGATFHLHYCMDKLVAVQFWHQDSPCSKCLAKAEKTCAKPCCKDKHQTVKLEKEHKVAESNVAFKHLATAAVPLATFESPQAAITPQITLFPLTHAPPRSNRVPAHILHCTFRI